MQATRSEEARAFRELRRLCYAGLDSVGVRRAIAERLDRIVPSDASTLATTDPDTGLFTHAVATGLPDGLTRAWVGHIYPRLVAEEIIDLAQAGVVTTASPSGAVMDLLRPEGFGHDLRTVLAERSGLWGFSCLLRDASARSFSEREIGFMRRLGPHLTTALRNGALIAAAPVTECGERLEAEAAGRAPVEGCVGVIVLDAAGRMMLRSAGAARLLEELADVGTPGMSVPYAIASAVVQLRARRHEAAASEGEPLQSELQVRGRSGAWLRICAAEAEPDPAGRARTIVLIEPATRASVAQMLTRLYGLSPREREILAHAARGASTKAIAARLRLSAYTVQEHLGNACGKVGVRSRRELLAKLFFDVYAAGVDA